MKRNFGLKRGNDFFFQFEQLLIPLELIVTLRVHISVLEL